MKRDRKKGSRPEYEDLLYDETPSVVVYYPSRGDDPQAPEPTVRRDRSSAFVPDLGELEPLTREQPAVEAAESAVTPLSPGRAEPVVDPAKPVPASLQSRGLLAWDPTHRDPADEDGFSSFFRTDDGPDEAPVQRPSRPADSTPPPPVSPTAQAPAPAPAGNLRPVVFETDIIAADFIEADAIRADPVRVDPVGVDPVGVDPVRADAVRSDVTGVDAPAAPVRRTIIEELPDDADLGQEFDLDPDLEQDLDDEAAPTPVPDPVSVSAEPAPAQTGFPRPVEVISGAEAVARPEPSPVPEPPRLASVQASPVAAQPIEREFVERTPVERTPVDRGSAFGAIDDEPESQMRFLREWEAEVTGTQEAQLSANHTGRLFRSLRAHPQPETLPAVRREQAARFRSLSSTQDSGPVAFNPRAAAASAAVAVADPIDEAGVKVAPLVAPDVARIWTASSMSGMKPGLVYLIPLVATVVVGIANALFLGPGIGWPTGIALLASSLVGALRIRLIDASVAVIAPPLAFLAAAATAGQIGMGTAGGPVIGAASNLFLALSNNVLWLVAATLASLLVVVIRTRRDRA